MSIGGLVRICVGAVLVRDGEILLGRRSPQRDFYPDVWDVPGGHSVPGESLSSSLVRELKEELGVIPVHYTLVADLQEPMPDRHGEAVYHIFIVTKWTGEPRNLDEREHVIVQWFPIESACTLELAHPAYPQLFRSILGHSPRSLT